MNEILVSADKVGERQWSGWSTSSVPSMGDQKQTENLMEKKYKKKKTEAACSEMKASEGCKNLVCIEHRACRHALCVYMCVAGAIGCCWM